MTIDRVELEKLTWNSFADDTALVSDSRNGITQLGLMALPLFQKVGFEINHQKSVLISVEKGQHIFDDLNLIETEVSCLKKGETVKYLVLTFKDEKVFKILKHFAHKLNLEATQQTLEARDEECKERVQDELSHME